LMCFMVNFNRPLLMLRRVPVSAYTGESSAPAAAVENRDVVAC